MKLLKKVLVFALIAVMVLTAAACGEKDEDGNKGNAGATATPKPTPKLLVCDLTPAQLNSYYVEYTTARRTLTRVRKKQIMPYGGRGFGAIYAELFRRCMAEKVRYGVSDSQALARVLCEGNASCWFMSGQSARSSYYAGRSLYRRLAVNEAA